MHSAIWVALVSVQYAANTLAAPPQTFPQAITLPPQTPTPTASGTATSESPFYGYFRTVIGDMLADLPNLLTNAALATNHPNATANIPTVTASLPYAYTHTIIPTVDYPINSPHRTYKYSVPHTLTSLILHLANPGQVPSIDPAAYAKTLLSLQRSLQATINSTGDGWLARSEDPYGWDIGLGCWVEFWSNPDVAIDYPDKGTNGTRAENGKERKQHLTLGIMSIVVEGLLQRLVYKGIYEFVYVEVWDGVWGQVGMGLVSPAQLPGERKNNLAEVLATLRIEGKR